MNAYLVLKDLRREIIGAIAETDSFLNPLANSALPRESEFGSSWVGSVREFERERVRQEDNSFLRSIGVRAK
jgi:hypothetical protein